MAYAVIPVVYPVAGTTTDIIHDYNGLIASHIAPDALMTQILRLKANQALVDSLRKNAHQYASLYTQEKADAVIKDVLYNIKSQQ